MRPGDQALKRELARVTEERDILENSRVVRQGCKVKYAFIALHRWNFRCARCAAFCAFIRVNFTLG